MMRVDAGGGSFFLSTTEFSTGELQLGPRRSNKPSLTLFTLIA